METVHRSFRLPITLDEKMNRRRVETGVPTSIFVRRLIEAALKQEEQFAAMRPAKPKRRKIAS